MSEFRVPVSEVAATDPTAPGRKEDHIELAFRSQIDRLQLDERFDYEPLLAAHPRPNSLAAHSFAGKQLRAPLWVSSMTGGTQKAHTINHNLARAVGEFGLGMGLGSCRSLLYDDARFEDFNVRPVAGSDVPLFANLGIAQVETLLEEGQTERITQLITALELDGLIVHVNPLQEWLQPEGDRFRQPPIRTVRALLAALPAVPLVVKEVGQGMGPKSLTALLQLPLLAVDTAANGGTNFSKLELYRSDEVAQTAYAGLAAIGHAAADMVQMVNQIVGDPAAAIRCEQLIVSGGVPGFLDGYYLTEISRLPAIYGQASAFLRYARADYATLQRYVASQLRGLELARAYLSVRS